MLDCGLVGGNLLHQMGDTVQKSTQAHQYIVSSVPSHLLNSESDVVAMIPRSRRLDVGLWFSGGIELQRTII